MDFVPVPDPTRKTSTRTRPIPAGTGRPAHLYHVVHGVSVEMAQEHKQIRMRHLNAIGVDLAGLLGARMASAESGSVSSEVKYGEGCPLSSRLRGLGSVVSSPCGVRGRAPAENGFWRILKATERLFFVPI